MRANLKPPKLRIEGLTKLFANGSDPPLVVFENLDFAVGDLEFVSVVGPSGCGKSTLLRIIDGLERADAGTVYIDGAAVSGPGSGRAMVFQSFDLFPWRTTIDNIAFGLEMMPMPAAERLRISRHYLDLVGLRGFEKAYPHQLSGGMQQRVGIARALATKPDVLLMDEPFGALDVQTRDLLQDEMLRIFEAEAKTVVFVTHSIEEAIYLADRIIVLSPRPARVSMDVRVPFARPRHEDIKGHPDFVDIRWEIWNKLKGGSPATDGKAPE
jgi:NitT/TauT family transport system ATP-binding protein